MERNDWGEDSMDSATSEGSEEIFNDPATGDGGDSPSSPSVIEDRSEDASENEDILENEDASENDTQDSEDVQENEDALEREDAQESETEAHDDKGDDEDAMKVEGSIHLLCKDKLQKLLPNRQNPTEKAMVEALVKNVNEKKKTTGNFELEPTSAQDSDLLCQVLPQNNFHIKLYASQ